MGHLQISKNRTFCDLELSWGKLVGCMQNYQQWWTFIFRGYKLTQNIFHGNLKSSEIGWKEELFWGCAVRYLSGQTRAPHHKIGQISLETKYYIAWHQSELWWDNGLDDKYSQLNYNLKLEVGIVLTRWRCCWRPSRSSRYCFKAETFFHSE